jgi:hypothetical protein
MGLIDHRDHPPSTDTAAISSAVTGSKIAVATGCRASQAIAARSSSASVDGQPESLAAAE